MVLNRLNLFVLSFLIVSCSSSSQYSIVYKDGLRLFSVNSKESEAEDISIQFPGSVIGDLRRAALSPDGSKLAVVTKAEKGDIYDSALYILDAETFEVLATTDFFEYVTSNKYPIDQADVYDLSWSPQGNKIVLEVVYEYSDVFFENVDPTTLPDFYPLAVAELFVFDIELDSLKSILYSDAGFQGLSWDSSGSQIIFGKFAEPEDRGHEKSQIYVFDLASRNLKQLTNCLVDCMRPSVAHDKIVYMVGSGADDKQLYVMNLDGSYQNNLTNNQANYYDYSISPDANKVVFMSDRSGDQEIYTINIDGSDPQKITNTPSIDTMPRWSEDSSRLMFVSDRSGSYRIYILDLNDLESEPLEISSLPYGVHNFVPLRFE